MFFGNYRPEVETLAAIAIVCLILASARLAWRALRSPAHRYDVQAYIVGMADYRSQSPFGKPKLANFDLGGTAAAAYVRREHASQPFDDGRGVVAG
jgi:hypothetical protein